MDEWIRFCLRTANVLPTQDQAKTTTILTIIKYKNKINKNVKVRNRNYLFVVFLKAKHTNCQQQEMYEIGNAIYCQKFVWFFSVLCLFLFFILFDIYFFVILFNFLLKFFFQVHVSKIKNYGEIPFSLEGFRVCWLSASCVSSNVLFFEFVLIQIQNTSPIFEFAVLIWL